jgi:hypothetical protein
MKKLTRNLTLALMFTATWGLAAYADGIPTGTDPVPPIHGSSSSSTSSTTATILDLLLGVVL